MRTARPQIHVNVLNDDMSIWNPRDPVAGFAGIPRNMTTMAMKLKAAGYKTHMAGKWDAGMATEDHTPQGRGYDTSLNYFHHANDVRSRNSTRPPARRPLTPETTAPAPRATFPRAVLDEHRRRAVQQAVGRGPVGHDRGRE